MAFVLAYLVSVAVVVAVVGSFFTVVSVRNRLVTAIGQLFSMVANPLATLAEHIRSWSSAAIAIIPETAFAPGIVRRLLYGFTFIVLAAVDFSLSAGRLAVAFGVEGEQLPIDIGWVGALGWIAVCGFFAAMSLDLRAAEVAHPWDALTARARLLCRWLSDTMLVLVALSGVVFYAWGSLTVAGSYPLLPVVTFMGLLGLTLVVASGVAFWASHDAWATLWGLLLVVGSLALRLFALLPELIVVFLRRSAHLSMSAIDVPMLGVGLPLLRWWTNSRLGKALGTPPLEEPIAWPEVGVVELPAEAPDGVGRAVVAFPQGGDADLQEEDAA